MVGLGAVTAGGFPGLGAILAVAAGGGVCTDIGLGAVIVGGVVLTGLGASGPGFFVGDGFWATAIEAIAKRVVSAKVVGLMVWRLW
jgi:hypothetical protein